MALKNGFGFKVNQKSVEAAMLTFKERLALKLPEAAKFVSELTYAEVVKSGNIPRDTGKLRTEGHTGIKDKFKENAYIYGWTTEYAKSVYFNKYKSAERSSAMINGKRRLVLSYSNGIPFWDRPITGNSTLMREIYVAAGKMAKIAS